MNDSDPENISTLKDEPRKNDLINRIVLNRVITK